MLQANLIPNINVISLAIYTNIFTGTESNLLKYKSDHDAAFSKTL